MKLTGKQEGHWRALGVMEVCVLHLWKQETQRASEERNTEGSELIERRLEGSVCMENCRIGSTMQLATVLQNIVVEQWNKTHSTVIYT